MSSAHRQRRGAAVVLAHVEVAVAVEFDDPGQALGEVGGELVVVDRLGGGDEERVPAGVGEALGEVALVVVDEEVGVHVADRGGRLAADQQRARLRPVDPPGRRCPCSARSASGAGRARRPARSRRRGSARRRGPGSPSESSSCGVAARRLRVGVERRDQRRRRARPQLGVLVQQQAVAALRLAHQGRVVLGLAGPPLAARSGGSRRRSARTASAEPSVGGVVEDEDLALDPGRVGALDRGQAGEQVLAAVRVHDAVGERGRHSGSR